MSLLGASASPLTAVDDAIHVLAGGTIAVLTGAGVSTDSGIPDYRGEGTPVRKPMQLEEFVKSAAARRRYWAGSHIGWKYFSRVIPNDGHRALAALEQVGRTRGIITQNVDTLHERAGNSNVIHMHGRLDRVKCLHCGEVFSRAEIGEIMADANDEFFAANADLRPDGDANVTPGDDFAIPACPLCGGMLKPDVVFFGELLDTSIVDESFAQIRQADAMLVAGSSLAVNSGLRMVREARRRGLPIVIVNRGVTKADRLATVRLEGGTSELLTAVVDGLTR